MERDPNYDYVEPVRKLEYRDPQRVAEQLVAEWQPGADVYLGDASHGSLVAAIAAALTRAVQPAVDGGVVLEAVARSQCRLTCADHNEAPCYVLDPQVRCSVDGVGCDCAARARAALAAHPAADAEVEVEPLSAEVAAALHHLQADGAIDRGAIADLLRRLAAELADGRDAQPLPPPPMTTQAEGAG